ncbi:MAG TPA: Rieske 2Fe-2S domain-containing protein [Panacibacter sp.]|nr:Rieske 2Fe-2S domain-containing protein [Panacibacter sp.]HNP43073.1 Rieske 2Fe-2S domain-containing protein [Panacibacter sp.]
MNTGRYKWTKIAESVTEFQFAANNMTTIQVADKTITIARKDKDLFACANKCPHAGGIISEGFMDAAGNLVCPLHRYRFNPRNGRNVSGEGYFLKHWPIEQRADGIYIGMEEKGLFGF